MKSDILLAKDLAPTLAEWMNGAPKRTGQTTKQYHEIVKTPRPVAAGGDVVRLKTTSVDIDPKALSAEFALELIDQILAKNPGEGKKLWDCMAAVRGPDIGLGAENRPLADGGSPAEADRVARKKQTTSIIRGRLFPGAVNCSSADIVVDDKAVIHLPPKAEWDHFDKHIFKVCQHRKIPYQIGEDPAIGLPPAAKAAGKTTSAASWTPKEGGLAIPVFFPGLVNGKEIAEGQIFEFVSPGFDDSIIVHRLAGGPGKNYSVKSAVDTFPVKGAAYRLEDWSAGNQAGVFVEVVAKATTPIPPNMWGLEKTVGPERIVVVPVTDAKWASMVSHVSNHDWPHFHLDTNNTLILKEPDLPEGDFTMYTPAAPSAAAAKVK